MRIKKLFLLAFVFVLLFTLASVDSQAQCSICTRTAQQLGEKPARGLNAGILYLAFTPLVLLGVIGYKFYKKNNEKA
ncbi:MAG: hypothetical protein ACXVBF_12180 [Flavisolibacter sp.]